MEIDQDDHWLGWEVEDKRLKIHSARRYLAALKVPEDKLLFHGIPLEEFNQEEQHKIIAYYLSRT